MNTDKIQKVIKNTKQANEILGRAGKSMFISSFSTAKKIANLYKEAGFKAFDLSKEVVQKTVELTINNQKNILKTSGNAIKEAVESVRVGDEQELKTMTKATAKRAGKTKN